MAPLLSDRNCGSCIGHVRPVFKPSDAAHLFPEGAAHLLPEGAAHQTDSSGGVWATRERCDPKCSKREALSARTRFFGITPSRCSL